MKLSTSMVTTFLSMERFIAIWFPKAFARFNQPKVAWICVLISFLFSLLSFSPAFSEHLEERIADNKTTWVSALTGSNVGGNLAVTYIIYAAKAVTSIVMVVCCIGVAIGLVVKSKKTTSMTTTARSKWRENRRLSILQVIIAALQIIDHVMWVISSVVVDAQPPAMYLGLEAITMLTYEEAMNAVEYKFFSRWTFASQEVTGILDHAARLPLYLVGMKKFRIGFYGLFGKTVSDQETTTKAYSQNASAVHPISAGNTIPVR